MWTSVSRHHERQWNMKVCDSQFEANDVYLRPSFFFSFSFLRTTSTCLSRQLLFLSLIGRLPTYLPVRHIIMYSSQQWWSIVQLKLNHVYNYYSYLHYTPFISLMQRTKSLGSRKLAKPKPFVFFDRLSRTTLALTNDGYLLNARVSISSVTSLPRSPQNIRKSSAYRQISSHCITHPLLYNFSSKK